MVEFATSGPPPTRFAKVDGLSIAYQIAGDGPIDVIVVPGFMSHVEMNWDFVFSATMLERMATFSRVVIFDKRGSGLSDRSLGAGTLEDRMEDVRAVMDDAGIERAALIGLSNGGPIATLFAAKHPDRVSSLLLAMAGCPGLEPIDEIFESVLRMIEDFWTTGMVLNIVVQHPTDPDEAVRQLARFERYCCTPAVAAEIMRVGRSADLTPFLPLVRCPTMVVHHRGDPIAPVGQAEYLAEHIPGAEARILDGDFHLSWRPADYDPLMTTVQEFLTGTTPPPYQPADTEMSTVVFTDIVDSTSILHDVGDQHWGRLLDRYLAGCRAAVADLDGVFVKETGDGMLAHFERPSAAVRCALAARESADALGLRTRAGVHIGEVEPRADDISGLAVHFAARVMAAAPPGEVLVSRPVRDVTAGALLRFDDHGEHELKGLPGRWPLFRVVA